MRREEVIRPLFILEWLDANVFGYGGRGIRGHFFFLLKLQVDK